MLKDENQRVQLEHQGTKEKVKDNLVRACEPKSLARSAKTGSTEMWFSLYLYLERVQTQIFGSFYRRTRATTAPQEKIKLNKQLPYLVGNVVEILDQVPEVRDAS